MAGNIPPPPPGYTLKPSAAAVPPPPVGYTLQKAAPTPEAPEGGQQPPQPKAQGSLAQAWAGLSGKDSSKAGAFGMGVADPFVGIAQMAQHAFGLAGAFESGLGPEEATAGTSLVDKGVKEREQQYQQGRPAAGRLGTDWMRLLGNVASPANVAIGAATGPLGAEAGIAGRMGTAALGGGLAAGAEPLSGDGNFAGEKAKQVALGAGSGAALGAAVEPLVSAISGRTPAAVESFIQSNYNRSVKPPIGTRSTASQVDAGQDQIRTAIDSIVDNKSNLKFDTPTGQVSGQLPQTLDQFSDAIEQTRQQIFDNYDRLAKTADTADTGATTSATKFHDAFAAASRQATNAAYEVAQADRAVTQAAARQSRAGNNVYSSAAANQAKREADARLATAKADLAKATTARDAAKKNLRDAWVDLDPIVGELDKLASSTLGDTHPAITQHVNELMSRLMKRGAYSPSEAQEVIQRYNSSLKAFYKNPNYENAMRASVDALVANRLRGSLDDLIEKAGGQGYQALKTQYGALKAIEKNVVRAAEREANKTPGGGPLAAFGNIMSAEQILRGIATLNPKTAATGAALKAAQLGLQKLRSPNYAVNRLFRAADAAPTVPSPTRRAGAATLRALPPVAGAPAGRNEGMSFDWPARP